MIIATALLHAVGQLVAAGGDMSPRRVHASSTAQTCPGSLGVVAMATTACLLGIVDLAGCFHGLRPIALIPFLSLDAANNRGGDAASRSHTRFQLFATMQHLALIGEHDYRLTCTVALVDCPDEIGCHLIHKAPPPPPSSMAITYGCAVLLMVSLVLPLLGSA